MRLVSEYDDQSLKVWRQGLARLRPGDDSKPHLCKAARDAGATDWVSRAGCCSTEKGHMGAAEDAERRRGEAGRGGGGAGEGRRGGGGGKGWEGTVVC